MAHLDTVEAHEHFRDRTLEGIQDHFPMKGKFQTLHLDKLEVQDDLHPDDLRAQHKAKIEGGSFSVPVFGSLRLVDNSTGAVVSQRRIRLAEIPKITQRYSYILDGQEYQMDNQWQLKPGAYTRRRQNGELETRFNVTGKSAFDMVFDPSTKQFHVEYNKAKLPVYPLMKSLGVDDDTIERALGKDVLHANKAARGLAGTVEKFYKTDKRADAPSREEADKHFYEAMAASKMRPEATALTLGKPLDHVNGEAFVLAAQKLMKVQGGHPEDDRDSLIFKDLRSGGDYVKDKMRGAAKVINAKVGRKINTAKDVRDIVKFDMFNEPIKQAFTKNSASRFATQINPVEMISSSFQTTIMGSGGIKSEQQIVDEAKLLNPSHFGFLDPINTPEGSKTGVTLRLPMGVKKVGNEAKVPLYNLKTGKIEDVAAGSFMSAKVVLPDQVSWDSQGKPHPLSSSVKMAGKGNEIEEGKMQDAHYVMRHSSQLLNMTSNLIPYLGNSNGNRASMATRHIEQAISLLHREPPMVQVATGSDVPGKRSFEEVLGAQASHASKISGTIKHVGPDGITIQDAAGKSHEIQLYNNYPLNDSKSVLHSTPTVKVGDRVSAGQNVADTNYSKNGVLALGTNLRVGYLPFKGYNFEDGVVISKSASDKLSSVHMYKHTVPLEGGVSVSKKSFLIHHGEVYKPDQIKSIGEDGLPRIGARVAPGDPLVLAIKPYDIKDRVGAHAIRKSLSGTHTDKSLKWDGETEGEVVGVSQNNGSLHVHVKAVEPMQVGDKIAGRYGNKGICHDPETQVLTDAGWKYFYDVGATDLICTLNPLTRQIEYQLPTAYIEQDYVGDMYRFQGRRLDLMATPEHRFFVRTPRSKDYRLEAAKDCFGHVRVHLRTGNWVGEERDTFTIPGAPEKPHGHKKFQAPCSYGMDDFLEFFGYWVTEGSLGDDSHISIGQRKSINPETYEAIGSVLERLGYTFHEHEDGFVLSDPRLRAWLSQFGTSLTKYLPREFLVLGQRQLRILADALFAGDGGVYFREKDNHTRSELFTSSARLADDYQELALKLGFSANVKPQDRDRPNIEYVVRWSLREEVYTQADARYASRSETWEPYTGKVYCVEVPNHVIYVRRNGIPVWSGNCTMILPDHEMPHYVDPTTKKNTHIEVALNPSGVPGRMNVGQVLETAASKIVEKTGKTVVVPSFMHDGDMVAHLRSELKKHGLSDTEELHDPVTGQSLGQVLVGKQHLLKLVHQVDKKVAVSSGMPTAHNPATYDINLQPKAGQRIGSLGMYALLAHGAKANLREMQTWKGEGPDDASKAEAKQWKSQHTEVWRAIQTGSPLPTPKSTFAFRKFEDMLKGAGVNIEKKGHDLLLSPLTDKHILELTEHRVLTKPGERLESKVDKATGELKPRHGGIFDERLTGGHGGLRWSRIDLAEPVPNPVFEAPIRSLTGLAAKDYEAIVAGEKGVHQDGHIVPTGKGVATGGQAIKQLLGQIDVARELKKSQEALSKAKPIDVDKLLKKVKYLRALDGLGTKPEDAYVLHHVPVVPPAMRPASLMADGNIKYADINHIYSDFAQVNEQLRDPVISKNLTDERKADLRRNLYDGMKAITGYGVPYAQAKHKGLLHSLSGASPKTGFFQNVLVQKRQDLTMRSTIVPEPALGLDEVGLPREHAIDLFRPFLVKKLQDMGAAPTPLDAQKLLLKKRSDSVNRALEKVMEERPVLLKRDPALHKYSVQGFNAKVVDGNAIKIHPLVVGGFNADFDGDTMSVFVPISREAVMEAHKMKPSNNLFSEGSGKIAYQPTLESALGIYKLSIKGKDTGKNFKSPGDILEAARHGKLHHTDVVSLNGKKTTPGRLILASTLPESMQLHVTHDLDGTLDKKGLDSLLTTMGKDHHADFDRHVNMLKDIGNGASFGAVALPLGHARVANLTDPKKNIFIPIGTHSLSLADFDADKSVRSTVLNKADADVGRVKKLGLQEAEQNRRVVDIYTAADKKMRDLHEEKMDKDPSNLFMMYRAGVKPQWDQYKQMVLAPMLVKDSSDRVIPVPVTKSYGEGLDVAGYWTQMHGARRGTVRKVQEVQEPGYMSKLLMNNTMNLLVAQHDCGTSKGILLSSGEKDVHDRHLAQDYKNGNLHIPAGTLLTPDLIGQVRAADKNAKLLVRSPLKCEHASGICQKCAGIASTGNHHEIGSNLGVLAAQTVGERSVQLTLKAFHTGGVVEQGGGKLLNSFARFEQLATLPKTIPNSASLAMSSGTVDKIEHTSTGVNVVIGGRRHFVGKDTAGHDLHVPLGKSSWEGPKVGDRVEAGQMLSDPGRTYINPHDLYKATGSIDKVQNHMASEIYDLYKDEGIKRRHVETVVKAMSNLTKVVHPGDSEGVLRGEFQPLSVVQRTNSDLVKQGLRPIEHMPVLKGVSMMPLALQEDWMAKLQHQKLRNTIAEGAAFGATSHLHGSHPIPGLAYGAEFGVNKTKANLPGYGHLKDVPEHNY